MIFECGRYTANSGGSQTINLNEISAVPDLVYTKKMNGTGRYGAYRTSEMTNSQRLGHATTHANGITALNAGSFDIEGNQDVNESTNTYQYQVWYDDGNGDFEIGTYTGNASATQDIATGLSDLECVWVFPNASANDAYHCLAHGGASDLSSLFTGDNGDQAGYITDISTTAGQFTAGSNLNNDGATYRYVAFAPVSGLIDSVNYTGDGIDGHTEDVDPNNGGGTPEFVIIARQTSTTRAPYFRANESGRGDSGDSSSAFQPTGQSTGRLKDFTTETIELGASNDANEDGITYRTFWLISNPAAGGPGPTPIVVVPNPQRNVRNRGRWL